MITEDYLSFEVAKLLKEKGFDEKCSRWYVANEPQEGLVVSGFGENQFYINAPTLQMAMKWLREVHNLYIEIFVTWRDKIPHYQWRINNLITQDTIVDTPCLEKPEEAVEAGIKYCLEKLI